MNHKKYIKFSFLFQIFVFCGLCILVSCGDKSPMNQLKGKGEVISKQIIVDHFYSIHVYDDLTLVLNNDSLNFNQMTLEGGENLLANINVECKEGVLSIRNRNRFKWLNNYNSGVRILASSFTVKELVIHDAANVETPQAITQDTLHFKAIDASGIANLSVHCNYLHIYSPLGMSDIVIKGTANSFYCYNAEMGFVNASGLQCDYVHIHDFGTNDMYAPQCHQLGITIENIGDIYYSGQPDILWEEYRSTGRLKKNE